MEEVKVKARVRIKYHGRWREAEVYSRKGDSLDVRVSYVGYGIRWVGAPLSRVHPEDRPRVEGLEK